MNPRTRGRALLGIGAVLAVVLVVGGRVAVEAIEIGVAHKAKTLCSGVFVSRRDPAAVLAELQLKRQAAKLLRATRVAHRARRVRET
jgi:hypothetical protein